MEEPMSEAVARKDALRHPVLKSSSSRLSMQGGNLTSTSSSKGMQVGNQTILQMFLSGRTSVSDLSELEGFPADEVCDVDFFPDPPCIAPAEEEHESADRRGSLLPQAYFKSHATWTSDDPEVALTRRHAQEFVQLWTQKHRGQGSIVDPDARLRKTSVARNIRSVGELSVAEAFVNVCTCGVGVRSTNSLSAEAKTGEVITPGECVVVDMVVEVDHTRFLRLADGRGWVFDTDGNDIAMAKLEEVETGFSWYRVACTDLVDVRRAPTYDEDARTGRLLSPQEMVVVDIRARVRGHRFVHLVDGRGWVFCQVALESKLTTSRSMEIVMEECDHEVTEGRDETRLTRVIPPTNGVVEVGLWTYIVGSEPVLALGSKVNGNYLEPGDLVKVDKRAYADGTPIEEGGLGQRWLRLLDGRGWLPEIGLDGQELVTLKTEQTIRYRTHMKRKTNLERSQNAWMVGIA